MLVGITCHVFLVFCVCNGVMVIVRGYTAGEPGSTPSAGHYFLRDAWDVLGMTHAYYDVNYLTRTGCPFGWVLIVVFIWYCLSSLLGTDCFVFCVLIVLFVHCIAYILFNWFFGFLAINCGWIGLVLGFVILFVCCSTRWRLIVSGKGYSYWLSRLLGRLVCLSRRLRTEMEKEDSGRQVTRWDWTFVR